MHAGWDEIVRALGLGRTPDQLSLAQLILRGFVIFTVALILMRLGHKRSLARKTAFDTAFVIIIGAVLARAINGSAPFFSTIGVAAFLVLLHRVLGFAAVRWPAFERLLKGNPAPLLHDGKIMRAEMLRQALSASDLDEDLHLDGHRETEEIALARLERSGEISFVRK